MMEGRKIPILEGVTPGEWMIDDDGRMAYLLDSYNGDSPIMRWHKGVERKYNRAFFRVEFQGTAGGSEEEAVANTSLFIKAPALAVLCADMGALLNEASQWLDGAETGDEVIESAKHLLERARALGIVE